MKIETLGLDAFGPFTGVELDLSAGDMGLHLIFGPNEAGKSSSLRAVRQLLFGIEKSTPDNFVHEYSKLRLSATLRHSSGSELAFARRKGVKQVLQDRNGSPLPDDELHRFLGNVELPTFQSLFAMGHADLVDGGKDILAGKGQAGEMIFAAGAGLRGLRRIHADLEKSSDELFKSSRGQNQAIPRAIGEWLAARKALRDLAVPSDRYVALDRDLQETRALRDARAARRAELQAETGRLDRMKQALPALSARRQALADLEGFADLPRLPDDFSDRWRLDREQAEQARRDADRLAAEIAVAAAAAEADTSDARPDLLANEEAISRLGDQLALHREGRDNRPRIARNKQEREHKLREILRSIGRDPYATEIEPLRVRAGEAEAIIRLATDRAGLDAQRRQVAEQIEQKRRRLRRDTEALGALGEPPDAGPLARAIEAARKLGDTDGEQARLRSDLDRHRREAGLALTGLPGWSGTVDDLRALAPPLDETIGRFERLMAELADRRAALDEQVRSEGKDIRKLDERLRSLDLSDDIPTERDLQEARARRDESWRLVLAAWRDRSANSEAEADTLAADHERGVARADELSDRLRREAGDVAKKAGWLAERERGLQSLDQLEADRRVLDEQAAQRLDDWRAHARPLGDPPPSPAEARAWCRLRAEALARFDILREKEAEAEAFADRLGRHAERLAESLAGVGEPAPAAQAALPDMLERAAEVLGRIRGDHEKRALLLRNRERAEEDLDGAERERAEIDARAEGLATRWAAAVAPLGLGPEVEPEVAHARVKAIGELFQQQREIDDFARQIRLIDQQAEVFLAAVTDLAGRLAPELVDLPPDQAVRELAELLKQEALTDLKRRDAAARAARHREELATVTRAGQEAADRLARACRDASVESAEDLPAVDRRLAERALAVASLRQAEDQLRPLAGGLPLDDFERQVIDTDPDSFDDRLGSLDEEGERLDEEIRALDVAIGEKKREIAQIDGGDRAAVAEEKAEAEAARLRADVPRFAALKLASALLDRGIARYRERNQSPIIARASELFAELTAGSFARLEVDPDHGVIVGLRPEGKAVPVEGMSEGTCDQLYLALRLAALERWLDHHEPLPMVLDDLLLHFDDQRATAALRVLGRLSGRVQILFFTHHEHLLELARDALPDGLLFEHRLPTRAHEVAAAHFSNSIS